MITLTVYAAVEPNGRVWLESASQEDEFVVREWLHRVWGWDWEQRGWRVAKFQVAEV